MEETIKESELCKEMAGRLEAKLQPALEKGNLPEWLSAMRILYYVNYGKDILDSFKSVDLQNQTVKQSIDDFVAYSLQRNHDKDISDARAVQQMYQTLMRYKEKPETARLALKKIRKGRDSRYEWGMVAIFSKDMPFMTPSLGKLAERCPIIFYKPQSRCTEHAADSLYKKSKSLFSRSDDSIPVAYLKPMSCVNYDNEIRRGRSFIEFMDPNTRQTEDPNRFITAAVVGYYRNDQYRIPVPEKFLLVP